MRYLDNRPGHIPLIEIDLSGPATFDLSVAPAHRRTSETLMLVATDVQTYIYIGHGDGSWPQVVLPTSCVDELIAGLQYLRAAPGSLTRLAIEREHEVITTVVEN